MDNSQLSQRFKRYAHITTSVGGILARLLGDRYLGIPFNTEAHAENLKQSLGHLKGPVVKIAQILATVPDMIPPEYVEAFQELQSNAPPMGWPFVKRRMRSELGEEWEKQFHSFSKEAVAAASLGQVHKAISLEGQTLACKLQYPDMAAAIEADLKQLKFVLTMFETYNQSLSTREFQREIAARLYEELNYLQEAKHIQLFSNIYQHNTSIHIPEVKSELTTSRLLTMSWLEGQSFKSLLEAPLSFRNLVASHLFKAWYSPLYSHGVIHGDPHMGNYTFREDGSINLLDFGCIRIFPIKFVQGVLELYHALTHNDEERAAHAYSIWGFQNLNRSLINTLNLWAGYLYAPLLDNRIRPIEETFSGTKGRAIAGEIFKELQQLGKITPPQEFVFMDRAAVGLGSVFIRLRVELNWHQMFEEIISDFSPVHLQQRQESLLQKIGL